MAGPADYGFGCRGIGADRFEKSLHAAEGGAELFDLGNQVEKVLKNEKIACDVLGDWSRAAGLQGRANLLLTTAAQHEIGRGRVFPLTLKRWEVEARDGLEVVLPAELLALFGDATREGRAGPEDSAALTVAGAEK